MYKALISFRSLTFRVTRLLFWCPGTSTMKEMALFISGNMAMLLPDQLFKRKIVRWQKSCWCIFLLNEN